MGIHRWISYFRPLNFISFVTFLGITSAANLTLAQIQVDNSLGSERSVVTPNVLIQSLPGDRIDGGAIRSSNLFHSFNEFNVGIEQRVYFSNPAGIQNILSRVTGGKPSEILGTLGVLGNANLFLINPSGILFGPNAVLDVKGSFLGSTATSILFEDGTQFGAEAEPTPSLLTVTAPLGLQFGTTVGNIVNQSQAVNDQGEIVGLQVKPNQTLALVGGNITLQGGQLTARQGRVELGSVGSNSLVRINPADQGWQLSYNEATNFQDIQLLQQALVNTSSLDGGEGSSGNIGVQARNVKLADRSQMLANNRGSGPPGALTIRATESVEVVGLASETTNLSTETISSGNAGTLTIDTKRLLLRDGAQISTSSIGGLGEGQGGRLNINAGLVELIGTGVSPTDSSLVPSGLFAATVASGPGGVVTVNAQRLIVQDGAQVATTAFGDQPAGNLVVNAADITLLGTSPDGQFSSGLFSATLGQGSAGDVTVNAQKIVVQAGAQISTVTFGAGAGGIVTVNATDFIELDGQSTVGRKLRSSLLATSGLEGIDLPGLEPTGSGGNLSINTNRLVVRNGAEISTGTLGLGNGGTLEIMAGSIEVAGESVDGALSRLSVEAGNAGSAAAGDLKVTTNQLQVVDGAQVSARTLGKGRGGTVTINAVDQVEVRGKSVSQTPSTLTAQATNTGAAGNLGITTNKFIVRDGAEVTVSGTGSGAAGELEVIAGSVLLDNQGSIVAETQGGLGDITLRSPNIQLRRGSLISTNATGGATGGNITIDADTLVALENSDITANSEESFGGRVSIRAQGIFGTQFRTELTPESDITATSALGPEFSGQVNITTPDLDPSKGLVELETQVVDPATRVTQTCAANRRTGAGAFVVTGRGGLPPSPQETLNDQTVLADLGKPIASKTGSDSTSSLGNASSNSSAVPIMQAQGWIVNAEGKVVLLAKAPTATPQNPLFSSATCNAS